MCGNFVGTYNSPNVDDRHGNEDKAVEVDAETGLLRKTSRPGMGTIMAKERVGEKEDSQPFTIATMFSQSSITINNGIVLPSFTEPSACFC